MLVIPMIISIAIALSVTAISGKLSFFFLGEQLDYAGNEDAAP